MTCVIRYDRPAGRRTGWQEVRCSAHPAWARKVNGSRAARRVADEHLLVNSYRIEPFGSGWHIVRGDGAVSQNSYPTAVEAQQYLDANCVAWMEVPA